MTGQEASGQIQIQVNGRHASIGTPVTVASLVDLRNPRPPFAVEVNKQLVRRTRYAETPLRNGDQIEIVTLVGGG